jgi:carboxylesterase type B
LGALGFAASRDLESELLSPPKTGVSHGSEPTTNRLDGHVSKALLGNYGIVDQRNAFEWVQDHIRDFGGDPKNVTAFGISAGSASVHFHMLTGKPLFDRAICMSGSGPTLGPLPFEGYEEAWQDLCQKTGVQADTAKERLERLRAMKPLDILRNYSSAAMGAMADGNLFPLSWSFEDSKLPTRCKSIILGDTRVEGIILDGLSRRISQDRFQELIRTSFSTADAEKFANYFGFPTAYLPYETYRNAIRQLLSIMMFQFSNLRIAETYSSAGDAYLYHFEEPSPYPGATYGLPYHGQCALFMYNNETNAYPSGARHTAREIALMWTAFACGEQPWEPYSKSQRFMRFGPDGEIALKDMQNDHLRDYRYVDWLKDHYGSVKIFTQELLQLV